MKFDFIIVGAGSAGCVLANRLSANGRYSVAIIEAGGRDSYPWIHVPVGYFKTMGNPRTDWCFSTEPDEGLLGRSVAWPRGKVLGGSSAINGLLYVRGQPLDYEHWRELGNSGWGWNDVLPFFRRAESWEGGASDIRGGDGPLSVSKTRITRSVVDAWIDAALAAGYPRVEDYNGLQQEGVGYFQMTIRRGRRSSAAVAYLHPVAHRPNLKIFTHMHVRALKIQERRVTGLFVEQTRELFTFEAEREVILCAGAIGSPQLLMLSGIGPGAHLKGKGVEVHLPLEGVGRNLQDHLQARPVYRTTMSTINTELGSRFKQAMIGVRYLINRSGPMAMAASLGFGFLKTSPELEAPDIQFHVQPFSAKRIADGPDKFSAFTTSVLQLRPESQGKLLLKSPDPQQPPAIYPNYLATQTDCDTLVKAIRIARRIARLPPLRELIIEESAPGTGVADEDYEGLLHWARATSTTIFHPVGTCKMGHDPLAVVDERLRVRGIEGLRVADCSIMPRIVSGNTNAPAIMIGERASDLVLADAN